MHLPMKSKEGFQGITWAHATCPLGQLFFFVAMQNRAEKLTPFKEEGDNSLEDSLAPSLSIGIFVEGPCTNGTRAHEAHTLQEA